MNHRIRGKLLGADTESTGLYVWGGDRPFCFSFCNSDDERWVVEFPVDPVTRRVIYDSCKEDRANFQRLGELYADKRVRFVFHNGKHDVRMIEWAGLPKLDPSRFDDSMIASHVCNTEEPNRGAKELCARYANEDNSDEKTLKAAVVACRQHILRKHPSLKWKFAQTRTINALGVEKTKFVTPADYWLPAALARFTKTSRIARKWCRDYERRKGLELAGVCSDYAGKDAWRALLLWEFFSQKMEEAGSVHTYREEMELWPVTYAMEEVGVRVFPEIVKKEKTNAAQKARKELETMRSECGYEDHDPEKKDEIAHILYEKFKLPVKVRTTKTQQPAVNFDALINYMDVPYVRSLFQYRAATKSWSSFFDNYERRTVPDDFRENCKIRARQPEDVWCLHPDFQQVGPSTGRFACRSPNLQNTPEASTTRSPGQLQGRTPFGPRPGCWWYHWDYEQEEVRIFADVSQEKGLLEAIATGRELHSECANRVWGGANNPAAIRQACDALGSYGPKTKDKVMAARAYCGWKDGFNDTSAAGIAAAKKWLSKFDYDIVAAEATLDKKNARAKAKMVLFGKTFGGGPGVVARMTGTTYEQAKTVYADYDRAFPRIDEYSEELMSEAATNGYIETRFGRKIHVDPDYLYRCVNYKVQGSAADMMKNRMPVVHRFVSNNWGRKLRFNGWLIMTIHDELTVESRKEVPIPLLLRVSEIMEDHGGRFNLPLPTSMALTTTTWDKKEDLLV